MTDIVERLRLQKSCAAWYCEETDATLEDVADEIERLRAERDAAIMDADMQAREAGNMEYNARVLMAERDALRVALMPFALAAPLDLTPEMDDQYVDSSSDMFYDLTYGYFRKARIALGKDHQ